MLQLAGASTFGAERTQFFDFAVRRLGDDEETTIDRLTRYASATIVVNVASE